MRLPHPLLSVALASLALLGACGGSDAALATSPAVPPLDAGTIPERPTQAPSLAPIRLQHGCGWTLAYDPAVAGLGNTAFPDTGVRYWLAYLAPDLPPGTLLRIEGRHAAARYTALHVHDGNLFTLDKLADHQFLPDSGSSSPWLDITRRVNGSGGRYTAVLQLGTAVPPDAARRPNTLYRPAPVATDGTARRTTALAYRAYLPVGENTGGVGLPRLTLLLNGEALPLDNEADRSACRDIGARLYQDGAQLPGSTALIDPLPPVPRPVFRKFESQLLNASGTGVGLNTHNAFASIKTDRNLGELMLVRGLAASHTDGASATPQVRYWSFCQYGFNTQKVYGCVADRDAALDASGRYTLVVAANGVAPALATAALGFSNLPFGPERVGALTQRELLARPDFAESINNSGSGEAGAASRGPYQHIVTYCSRAVFEASAAAGAAAAFAACEASRRLLPG